jgi:hypothetical protein
LDDQCRQRLKGFATPIEDQKIHYPICASAADNCEYFRIFKFARIWRRHRRLSGCSLTTALVLRAGVKEMNHQGMGRSRGGLMSKVHAVANTNGLPVYLVLTPGEAHDNLLCSVLLGALFQLGWR